MAASSYARIIFGLAILIFAFTSSAHGKRTKDKIYIGLQTQNACFRTLNATHQFGCTSAMSGNVGVLYYMEGPEEKKVVLETGATPPYIVLLEAVDFKRSVVEELINSKRVSGILVNNVFNASLGVPVSEFSSDQKCPNNGYGMYKNDSDLGGCRRQAWNIEGQDLYRQDLGIPIFSLTVSTDVDTLLTKCYEQFNKPQNGVARTYPLCAVELKDRMAAVKDSITCIRRSTIIINLDPTKVCDPMGDKNVIGTVKVTPKGTERKDGSIIVAATRIDSFSMFNNEYYSAETSASGLIALLAAAEAIGKFKTDIRKANDSKDILFAFFQGEAFDYIGSSRLVYDMGKGVIPTDVSGSNSGQQPIRLSHLHSFLELAQVGLRDQGQLWLHTDPLTRNKHIDLVPQLDQMVSVLSQEGEASGAVMGNASNSLPLPPASVQRFLRKTAFPAVVLTDHEEAFTNKFYNSRFDLPSVINASYPEDMDPSKKYDYVTPQAAQLTEVATAVARSLYRLSTGTPPPSNLTASSTTVAHMLYCFLHSPHCELFNSSIDPSDAKSLVDAKQPFPFYVGVFWITNQVTTLTQRILAQFLGDRVEVNKGQCKSPQDSDKTYIYSWMQGPVKRDSPTMEREGRCYKAPVYTTSAKSPAFDLEDYDMLSGEYSTFTESVWSPMSARVFLIPSQQWQTVTLSVGVIILVFSFALTYLVNAKASVIFASRSAEYL